MNIKQAIREIGQQIYKIDAELIELHDEVPSYAGFRKMALLKTQRETLLYEQRWWMEREQAEYELVLGGGL